MKEEAFGHKVSPKIASAGSRVLDLSSSSVAPVTCLSWFCCYLLRDHYRLRDGHQAEVRFN
jgi:hypothetical protein